MAASVLAAEAGDGAAGPPHSGPPPAGGLRVQPAGPGAALLPSHLHQALHRVPGPAGSHRQSRAAAVGASAVDDAGLVDGGDGPQGQDGPREGGGIGLVEGGCERALSAAA